MSASPNFRTMLRSIAAEEVLAPALQSALYDPQFSGFTVQVPGFTARKPNGWFWPSTHPSWSDHLLYTYLTAPDDMVFKPFDPLGTMAVTAGTFFHSFVQHVAVENGILQRQETCGCGFDHPEKAELFVADPEVKSCGHIDGVLYDGSLFELKTMAPAKFAKIPSDLSERLAWLRSVNPNYYAQAQEYLRMSGATRTTMLVMTTSYPFQMTEIHIPIDPVEATALRDRYMRIRDDAANGRPYPCTCSPGDEIRCR